MADQLMGPGTWTLISLADDDTSMKVWHQHGAGLEPTPMKAAPVSSARLPAFLGRCYVCPECDELTVVSLPAD